jgi:hypothetical protein
MNNYIFGFRVINLSAKTHFVYAALYLVLGLQQLIAIQFLDVPRIWLTFYVLLIATTLVGSSITAHVTIIDKKEVQQALNYDPGSKAFLIAFLLAAACSIIWYVVPGIDTNLFRTIALSVSAVGLTLFTIYYVQVFQKHLDVNSREAE